MANFPNMQSSCPAGAHLIEQFAVAADDKASFSMPSCNGFDVLAGKTVSAAGRRRPPASSRRFATTSKRCCSPSCKIRRTRVARLQEASEGRERIRFGPLPGSTLHWNSVWPARGARACCCACWMRAGASIWCCGTAPGNAGRSLGRGPGVLDRLFAWLDPAETATVRSAVAAQALLSEIERALATVNVEAALLSAFVQRTGRQAGRRVNPAAGLKQRWFWCRPDRVRVAGRGRGRCPGAHRQLVDRLRVGDWWDFSVDGSRVPMQLIWASQPPLSCAFANRSATSKTDLTLAELSRQIQRDLARPGKDMDLPLNHLIEGLLGIDPFEHLGVDQHRRREQ